MKRASLVFYNGIVRSMSEGDPHSALAVADDRILCCGADAAALALLAPDGLAVDLKGRCVLPGFIETHLHPPGSILQELYSISLFHATHPEEILQCIRSFIAEHPEQEAYFGAGLITSHFGSPGPAKELLDALCPDKPIYIRGMDGHNDWLNSAALAACGLTRDSQPREGILHRRADGALWGICTDLEGPAIPRQHFHTQQRLEAIRLFQQRMLAWGYTTIHAMDGLEDLLLLAERNELILRVHAAYTMQPERDVQEQIEAMIGLRQRLPAEIRLSTAKFFVDGVVEGGTAYLSQPYQPGSLPDADEHYRGLLNWPEPALTDAISIVNRHGFDAHLHSIGDASTHTALNAIEAAQQRYPQLQARNSITHLQQVMPSDYPRFAQLGVVASIQPFWHLKQPSWWEAVDLRLLGRARAERNYPLRSLQDAGALLCSSSDYFVTPIPKPFWAIKAGVSRNLYNGTMFGVEEIDDLDDPRYLLDPAERVGCETMLQSYTVNSAFLLRRDGELGSLKPGYLADFIIVDADPFNTATLDLDKIDVQQTYSKGRCVFSKSGCDEAPRPLQD